MIDSVTLPKQDHKQQSHDKKQKSCSKKLCKSSKGESSNTKTNALIEGHLNEFKRKRNRSITNIQSVYSDAGEKDKSVNNE